MQPGRTGADRMTSSTIRRGERVNQQDKSFLTTFTGVMAILVVLATTALNGIVLFWAYVRVFLGPLGRAVDGAVSFPDLLPRERLISVSLSGLLLIGGFAASPLLSIRQTVVDALHQIDAPASHPHP